MYYILNKPINSQNLIVITLCTFKGISYKMAILICAQLGFGKKALVKELTKYHMDSLNRFIKQYLLVNADLTRYIHGRIQKLRNLRGYKGLRHKKQLPVHGQRTRSNAKTNKLKRKKRFSR